MNFRLIGNVACGGTVEGHRAMHSRHCTTPQHIPAAIKTAHTVFVAVLVPAYWRQYGPGNFLWFSDVALLTSVPALWLESPLLASTQAVSVLVLESLWIADFGAGVFARKSPIGLASYMFDRRLPRFVRALSLFHFWLVPALLLVIHRAGYDRRAFRYQSLMSAFLLLASWRLTKPEDNVNWVHSWPERIRTHTGRTTFVVLMMIAIPLAVYFPTHVLLKRLFHEPEQ
jgi:hypothetical protein